MTLFSVDMDFKGFPPASAEELVFSAGYGGARRWMGLFAALPVTLRGAEPKERTVQVQLKAGVGKGVVWAEERLGAERVERIETLAPYFFSRSDIWPGYKEVLDRLSPKTSLRAIKEKLPKDYVSRSCARDILLARVFSMAGIDCVVEGKTGHETLHIINPAIIESFSPVGEKEQRFRWRAAFPKKIPSARESLEKNYWTQGENWATSAAFVTPYRRGAEGKIRLVARSNKRAVGTAEDFVGLSFGRELGIAVPRGFDLVRWKGNRPALLCSYEGALRWADLEENRAWPAVLLYRMARRVDGMRVRFCALGYTDPHGCNLHMAFSRRAKTPVPVLIDPGGLCRRNEGGVKKTTWGQPDPIHYRGGFCLEPYGALSPREMLVVVRDLEKRTSGLEDMAEGLAEKLSKAGVRHPDFTPSSLTALAATVPVYTDCLRAIFEKQAAHEPLALRPTKKEKNDCAVRISI